MEASAIKYSSVGGLHARSPLLRLQSDERLVGLIRRGNASAFEVLVGRYHARLLAFCRHLLSSREDAEDVLQEVLAAAFNALQADDRPIHVRPWLYRIARNRCLNHLRRVQPIGVDSMDVHLSDHGASTADKVHAREHFRLLVDDIQRLPETQRSALVLREMDALSYEQIAAAMETTVPSVKSLLVRARISLAEAAEARQLGCPQVRIELAEVAEGLTRRPSALVRRHLRTCGRCSTFERQLKQTNKGLAALLPLGGLGLLRKLALLHVGHSAGTGSGAGGTAGMGGATAGSATAGGGAAAGGATAGGVTAGTATGVTAGTATGVTAGTATGITAGTATGVTAGTASGVTAGGLGGVTAGATGATAVGGVATGAGSGLLTAGAGVIATKAAAGLAAAALVTAGAIDVAHNQHHVRHAAAPAKSAAVKGAPTSAGKPPRAVGATTVKPAAPAATGTTTSTTAAAAPATTATTTTTATTATTTVPATTTTTASTATAPPTTTGSSQTSSDAVGQSRASSGTTGSTGTASDPGSGATGGQGATGTGGSSAAGSGATGATGSPTDSGGSSPSSASGPGTGTTPTGNAAPPATTP